MKFSCLQENLNAGLDIVSGPLSGKSTLPVTKCILVETGREKVMLTATDLVTTVVTTIDADVREPGKIAIPGKLLCDFVNVLPNDRVNVEVVGAGTLKVTCTGFETKVRGVIGTDFPAVPIVPMENGTRVNMGKLRDAIKHVEFAVGNDLNRAAYTGINMRFDEMDIRLAGTDGSRLATYWIQGMAPVDTCDVTVPARSLNMLSRIISGDETVVEVTIGKNQIAFRTESVELVSQVIQASYPDYAKAIPGDQRILVEVQKTNLKRAVNASALFSEGAVRFIINGDLHILGLSKETGENLCEVDAKVSGGELKVALNAEFLIGAINAVKDENILIGFDEFDKPCVFRSGDGCFQYVIMPMIVQW